MSDSACPMPPSDGAPLGGAFSLLGLQPRFDLDPAFIRRAWMQRAAMMHPDAAGAGAESAQVNAAFRTLIDPLGRAAELLQVWGAPSVDQRLLPEGFLVDMMELRERVDESAGDAAAIAALQVEAEHERSAALGRLAQIFASISTGSVGAEAARAAWTEMNVVRAFDRVLEQLQREAGGV